MRAALSLSVALVTTFPVFSLFEPGSFPESFVAFLRPGFGHAWRHLVLAWQRHVNKARGIWIVSTYAMGFDVKRLDIYRKIPKDLTQPTTTGAVVSVACVAFILLMLATELLWFISPDIRSELHVDSANPTDRIPVRINITIPRLLVYVYSL